MFKLKWRLKELKSISRTCQVEGFRYRYVVILKLFRGIAPLILQRQFSGDRKQGGREGMTVTKVLSWT